MQHHRHLILHHIHIHTHTQTPHTHHHPFSQIYDFPPPKMTTGCKEVMDQKEEAFERAFYANPLPDVDALKRTVCADICDSVSSSDKTSRKPEVFVNGEPVDTNARGDASEGAVPKKKTKKKRRKKTKKKKKKAKKKAKEEL